jgi:hypothetical protein
MIIFEDKGYMTRSGAPKTDWTNGQAKYVVEDGTELAALVQRHSPWFEPLEGEGGELVGIEPTEPPADMGAAKAAMLAESSARCRELLVRGFKCSAKNGEQTYRMNEDDQMNITGYVAMISFVVMRGGDMDEPQFLHKNITQDECEPWTASEILAYVQMWATYKAAMLHRQDMIKVAIMACSTADELEGVDLSYETSEMG